MESTRASARSAATRKDSGYRQRQGYRNREGYGFVRLSEVKNEIQMERRLNEIWIGSYKMRVKIANERQRKSSLSRKVQGVLKVSGSTSIMNRLVQPGQSYAQAVKGQGKREDKAPEQSQEKERKEAPKMEVVKTRIQENKEAEKIEKTIEYIPSGDELKWLEGGMVAVVRSMALVSEIQEQLDADGGSISLSPIGGRRMLLTEKVIGSLSDYMKHNEELFDMWFESITPWEKAPEEKSRMMWVRISGVPLKAWGERCFQMIGETIGEVLLVHEDTKKKAILWDGRVLIFCSESSKISNLVKLKVGEQVYEIEIVEEEWRSDPDWWLSEIDRRSDLETKSDFSNSWCQNEDPDLDMDVIGNGEDVRNGSEHLMKDLVSNSNLKIATEIESGIQIVQETELEGDASFGLSKEIGPQRVSFVGPIEGSGPTIKLGWGQTKEINLEEPFLDAQIEVDPSVMQKSTNTTKGSKKQRLLQDCYLESMEEIWAKGAPWVTPRTKQQLARRKGSSQAGDDKVHNASVVSISDGCIENRNKVLQREMNMHEVRRLMGVGKRLGLKFDSNKEQIQSKLIEAVNREGAERRDAKGRGLGGSLKKNEVRRLVQEEKPDFLFLQETKLEKVDVGICRQLWNSDEVDWVAKGSSGASGGLLCTWDSRRFVKREDFSGDGLVGLVEEWGANKRQYSLINVYGPNDRQKKASLWEELRKMVTDKEGCWLIVGDFNAVRGPEERRGRTGESPDMKDFDEFIVTTDLVDVKLSNKSYTWYKPDGTTRSRLDRFLLSTEMSNMEGEWIQQGLPRNISDHCAIVLKSRTTDWGPRPFRVLDAWQQHPDFKKFVEDKWREMEVEGYAGYKCQQKLKLLKGFLKGWNKEVFRNMEAQYEQAVKKIEQVDMQNEISDLEDAEIVKRQEGFSEMWDVLRKKELIWKQKSRTKVLGNRLKSVISEIVSETQSAFVGGRQLVDSVLVLNEVVDEFKKTKQPAFVFKADFEKAYDCVDWSFLDWMMERFGFGIKWRGWIMECLSTVRISVLVNGSPTKEFEVGKGLRQGDPLSPFLFLMIAEGLQGLVQRAIKEGMLHGIEIGKNGLSVSLLQFADDTVIMGRVNVENIRTVKDILKWFELMSGLRINFSKSSIFGYNVTEKWLKGSAGKWWYRLGDGVESLWKRVVREKYYGGRREVDITSVECFKVSKIWRDIIRIGGLSLNLRNMLVEGFKWEVGDGNRVVFWCDRWIGVKSLRDLFPRLFALSVKKKGKVSEMGSWEEGRWHWRVEWRRGTLGREKDEEELLEKLLENVKLKEGAGDVWKWVHVLDGKYGVLRWWGLEFVLPNTVRGVAEFFIGSLGSIVGKEMGSCIFLVVAWYLWYRRNVQVFRKDEGLPENLLERMQVKTFIWIKSKVNGCVFSFCDWQSRPMECAMAVKNHKRLRKQFFKARVPSG
ncbi:hypothetical protein SLEP1_g31939 [Rubroshorea leprosula]|uniref:Reverse transcriptase domain-containing protein n=1 Tax=Rubroshorea leprosula TaxID=152421 RepID=A0AAV5KBS6_9ROSI|nr:hypothetical protein SLEP1_g31939 [Rubroshorea leprosula]